MFAPYHELHVLKGVGVGREKRYGAGGRAEIAPETIRCKRSPMPRSPAMVEKPTVRRTSKATPFIVSVTALRLI